MGHVYAGDKALYLVLLLQLLSALAVVLGHIKALIDAAGDGLDLSAQLLLYALQVEAIVVRDQIDGQTQMSKASWCHIQRQKKYKYINAYNFQEFS